MQMPYELIRNADVKVTLEQSTKGQTVAINVNDKFEHVFPSTSRITKSLEVTPMEQIIAKLNGGDYFFIGDDLVDFRNSDYNGFIHNGDSIDRLMDVIGYANTIGGVSSTQSNTVMLSKEWDSQRIEVPSYAEGGRFESKLSFKWNPFHKNINSDFELVRLVCSNGMVGLSSFLNSTIPMVNRWEEHLDIATSQIQSKVNAKVASRMVTMGNTRASVADLQLVSTHAHERLVSGYTDEKTKKRLDNIYNIANPVIHLHSVYKPNVFNDKRLASQMAGHLSEFDLWNLSTELVSHSAPSGKSTDHGLNKLSNRLVFNPDMNKVDTITRKSPPLSAFSDPDRAFFGEVEVA